MGEKTQRSLVICTLLPSPALHQHGETSQDIATWKELGEAFVLEGYRTDYKKIEEEEVKS